MKKTGKKLVVFHQLVELYSIWVLPKCVMFSVRTKVC